MVMDIASREAAGRTAVIIGAGPGGLAAAILLAAVGIRVRIIERLPIVGGRTSTIEADGFRFDLGPTFFLYPRVLEEIMRVAGTTLEREVELIRLDPQYRLIFGAGGTLDCTPDVAEMERQIAAIAPADAGGFERFMRENRRKLELMQPCLENAFLSWRDVFNARLLRLLPSLRPHRSIDAYLRRFFSDARTRLAFSFQSKYLGPHRDSFGPIEADALRRYRFFARLGFFGVANGTVRGAAEFLRTSEGVLASRKNAIFITPQGQFADSRIRPLTFQRGLGHLASRVERAAFVPLAIEYVLWEERLPEVLFAFGQPVVIERNERRNPAELTQEFEARMEGLQDQLAEAAQRRQPADWQTLLEGRAGIARFYDVWRRTRALLRGEVFKPTHSDL